MGDCWALLFIVTHDHVCYTCNSNLPEFGHRTSRVTPKKLTTLSLFLFSLFLFSCYKHRLGLSDVLAMNLPGEVTLSKNHDVTRDPSHHLISGPLRQSTVSNFPDSLRSWHREYDKRWNPMPVRQ